MNWIEIQRKLLLSNEGMILASKWKDGGKATEYLRSGSWYARDLKWVAHEHMPWVELCDTG
jgi:hypothetical protein